jgi:hypothetical protein
MWLGMLVITFFITAFTMTMSFLGTPLTSCKNEARSGVQTIRICSVDGPRETSTVLGASTVISLPSGPSYIDLNVLVCVSITSATSTTTRGCQNSWHTWIFGPRTTTSNFQNYQKMLVCEIYSHCKEYSDNNCLFQNIVVTDTQLFEKFRCATNSDTHW